MSGTPLDLTPFGALLGWLGHLYWLIALAIVLLALWWPKRWWLKLVSAAVVTGAVVYPVLVRPVEKQVDSVNEEQRRFNERLSAAMAHFEMRCKSAGERISRTVENVDGVVWMKWRDKHDNRHDFDQFEPFDPYGRVCGGEDCISMMLFDEQLVPGTGGFVPANLPVFRFVESVDPHDGKTYRYVRSSLDRPLEREVIVSTTARYGVTWDDISTREDREHWIAGGSLKVVDLRTKEVVAERIGYVLDRGLGSTGRDRSPWPWAQYYGPVCPPLKDHNVAFVKKALRSNTTQGGK